MHSHHHLHNLPILHHSHKLALLHPRLVVDQVMRAIAAIHQHGHTSHRGGRQVVNAEQRAAVNTHQGRCTLDHPVR